MSRPLLFLAIIALAPAHALAQQADPAAPLSLTLDGTDQVEASCRLTFVARNPSDADVASLVVETVAFDLEGGVSRISLFDFGALPGGVPRVRQFDLPDTDCDAVGSILINGVQSCEGGAACDGPIATQSRAAQDLLG